MPAVPYKYWAFISYSHQDEAWAQWLHRVLETYRVPRRLVGRALRDETVPRRLFPVFRDRDELPSSHELGAVINRALTESRNLIVICSPRAATSRWVNEEIKAFRALGRSERIFCLIVDGEPNASANPEHAFAECFAPALREGGFEPIAADARPRKDGKAGAKLKLLAGLLDVGLDELKQREKQRRFWQRVQATAASLAVVGMLAGSWQWFLAQREAREQEILVEKLVENGRLELLDGRHARAAVYLTGALKLGADTVPVRFMLARAMEPVDAFTGVRVHHGGGPVRKAAFSHDGRRFVLVVRLKDEAVAKVYDSESGKELFVVRDVAQFPKIVQLLPDGNRLLISGLWSEVSRGRPRVGIWDLKRGEPILLLDGNSGLTGLPVHPDGSRLLHPSANGVLEIFDARSGRKVQEIRPPGRITAATYSPDGVLIAAVQTDGTVGLWRAGTGVPIARFPATPGLEFTSVCFTPDGRKVLALTASGDVRVWDAAQRSLVLAFASDYAGVRQLSFSPDSRRLLTIGRDGYKVWNAARGALLFSAHSGLNEGADALLTPDGNRLITVDHASDVAEVWDIQDGRKLYTYGLHTDAVTAVAMDPEGARLLLAGMDGYAEILDSNVVPWWRVQSFEANPSSVRFNQGGDRVLIAGAKGTEGFAAVYDVPMRRISQAFEPYPSYFFDVTASGDAKSVVAAAADGSAAVFDGTSGRLVSSIAPLSVPAQSARLNRDGTRALVRPWYVGPVETGVVRLWDAKGSRLVSDLGHAGGLRSAEFSPDGSAVATGGEDAAFRLWSAGDGRLLQTFRGHSGPVHSVHFSADGARLLTASSDRTVRIWDIASGNTEAMLQDDALNDPNVAIFSPREDVVAIGNGRGGRLWWPGSGKTLTLAAQPDVTQMRFLREGRLLITAGLDGTARAWDVATGQGLGVIASHAGPITGLDVDANEALLATADFNGIFGLWRIGLETRSAATLADTLHCKSPWRLNGTQLIQALLEPARCPPPRSTP